MLAKNQRLNLKTSFSFVVKGQKSENSLYKIFYREGTDQPPKVGIALKKEYFKLAVDRNRARRLTATAMQVLYPDLKESIYLILMPKTGVLGKSSQDLEKFLKEELNKIGLLK